MVGDIWDKSQYSKPQPYSCEIRRAQKLIGLRSDGGVEIVGVTMGKAAFDAYHVLTGQEKEPNDTQLMRLGGWSIN